VDPSGVQLDEEQDVERLRLSVFTVKKSVARIPDAWALRGTNIRDAPLTCILSLSAGSARGVKDTSRA